MAPLFSVSKLCLLAITVFQLALFVSARPQLSGPSVVKREPVDASGLLTNAARMQAGLGPLKPRSFYKPSRVAARAPSTSILPSSGKIQVKRASDGHSLGFISNDIGHSGFGVASSVGSELHVSFRPVAPFNIAISHGTHPDLGFAGDKLIPSSSSALKLTATNPTAPGSRPENVGNSLGGTSESSIWFYDERSHELTARWVNPDGSVLSPRFWHEPESNTLSLILDPPSETKGYEVHLSLA